MLPPASSRTIDPRLASASGVIRDTLGAIHNLVHLLGSMLVGPKALTRVIPDVQASCNQMVLAIREVVARTHGTKVHSLAVDDMAGLVATRMKALERALGQAQKGGLRAASRLSLERTVAAIAKDLDGALEIVELLSEASATGSVPVDVTDVIRESAVRTEQGASRTRRLSVTFTPLESAITVKMNPRLAMRLFAFSAALAADRERSVHVDISQTGETCLLRIGPAAKSSEAIIVAIPPLIGPTAECVAAVAIGVGARVDRTESGVTLTLPLAQAE